MPGRSSRSFDLQSCARPAFGRVQWQTDPVARKATAPVEFAHLPYPAFRPTSRPNDCPAERQAEGTSVITETIFEKPIHAAAESRADGRRYGMRALPPGPCPRTLIGAPVMATIARQHWRFIAAVRRTPTGLSRCRSSRSRLRIARRHALASRRANSSELRDRGIFHEASRSQIPNSRFQKFLVAILAPAGVITERCR